jgi:hypothetical protein
MADVKLKQGIESIRAAVPEVGAGSGRYCFIYCRDVFGAGALS